MHMALYKWSVYCRNEIDEVNVDQWCEPSCCIYILMYNWDIYYSKIKPRCHKFMNNLFIAVTFRALFLQLSSRHYKNRIYLFTNTQQILDILITKAAPLHIYLVISCRDHQTILR